MVPRYMVRGHTECSGGMEFTNKNESIDTVHYGFVACLLVACMYDITCEVDGLNC